jgi:hypothetical protein
MSQFTPILKLSVEYLMREGVRDFVEDYCKRNKIPFKIAEHPSIGENYFYLTFKSSWQMKCFVFQGNKNYPYFEFL